MLKHEVKPEIEKEIDVKFIKKVAPASSGDHATQDLAGKTQAARTEPKQFAQPCPPMKGD